MGEWRLDQSKSVRRYVWGETRGVDDPTRRDFVERMKPYRAFAALRVEKIGSEIHAWREMREDSGKSYWIPCLRFVADDWSYWTIYYRTDERRWRTTPFKDVPIGRALEALADFYQEKFVI